MSSGAGSKTTKKPTTTTTKTTTTKTSGSSGAIKKGKKKIAAAPLKAKVETKKLVNPLYEKRAKNFGIGQGKKSSTKISFIYFFQTQIFNQNVI
jgi:hypothetical protein